MLYDKIEGYSEEAAQKMPHAWKAGEQTKILRSQLEAMDDGGVVLIVAPPNPFRCPPGPTSAPARSPCTSRRTSRSRRSDPRQQAEVLQAGPVHPGLGAPVRLRHREQPDRMAARPGCTVVSVDADAMSVETSFGDEVKGAVINVIPPQAAGKIAIDAGLADDSGWCPVDKKTFESTLIPRASTSSATPAIATAMPKSGYSANSQGKVAAAAVVAMLNGDERRHAVLRQHLLLDHRQGLRHLGGRGLSL
jgi:sulfide dehydrogenase [flavocytochrome c] flavoprotein subunit